MIRKITSPLITIIICLAFTSRAQVTLQQNNMPQVGELWSNKTITDTTIQPGPGGQGMNWGFGNFFVYPNVISEQYVAPTGTGNDALFPSANLKVNSLFGGDEYYIRSAGSIQFLGMKSSTNEILITSAQNLLTVPFSFGNSVTNPAVTGTGFGYPLTGTISVTADGTGTLSLYTGAFTNTLRVVTDMDLILGAGSGVDTYVRIKKYTWYTASYRAPVFQIAMLEIDGPLGNAKQKVITVSTLTTDISDPQNDFFKLSIGPNPAAGNVEVTLNLKKNSTVDISMTDINGKVCLENSSELSTGINKLNFDISVLPKGIYLVSAIAGKTTSTKRLVID
jgi:hypothetical protein